MAYYDDNLAHVREAIAGQWTDAPLAGKVALEAEFRVALPKRVSKARRAAMLTGEIAPPYATNTLDGLLRGVVDAMAGLVVQDDRNIVSISGRRCYSETAGATLRVGEVVFYPM